MKKLQLIQSESTDILTSPHWVPVVPSVSKSQTLQLLLWNQLQFLPVKREFALPSVTKCLVIRGYPIVGVFTLIL